MLGVITSSYDNIDTPCYTGLVFADLRMTFDTVSHETLLEKLGNYSFQGMACNLIQSNLQNRQQFVSINQCHLI